MTKDLKGFMDQFFLSQPKFCNDITNRFLLILKSISIFFLSETVATTHKYMNSFKKIMHGIMFLIRILMGLRNTNLSIMEYVI